jgi:hypothetical protein
VSVCFYAVFLLNGYFTHVKRPACMPDWLFPIFRPLPPLQYSDNNNTGVVLIINNQLLVVLIINNWTNYLFVRKVPKIIFQG